MSKVNIEQIRRQSIFELQNEIAKHETSLRRDRETLSSISKSSFTKEFIQKKEAELTSKVSEREENIMTLKSRLFDMESKKLDHELEKTVLENTEKAKGKTSITLKKKVESEDDIQNKKKVNDTQTQAYSEERQNRNDMRYFHKLMLRADDSLPPYIRENLKEMPSNKGYIWRGCWFFGDLEPEYNQPMIMFERQRNGVLQIHEYTKDLYTLYEKKGKERKEFVYSKQRKLKKMFRRC